jgi:hypothetical protein
METACFSKTLASTNQSTWQFIPQEHDQNCYAFFTPCCEQITFYGPVHAWLSVCRGFSKKAGNPHGLGSLLEHIIATVITKVIFRDHYYIKGNQGSCCKNRNHGHFWSTAVISHHIETTLDPIFALEAIDLFVIP